MYFFKASLLLAKLVVTAQLDFAERLDVTSKEFGNPSKPLKMRLVQEAIGERLIRLAGTLSARNSVEGPDPGRTLIMVLPTSFTADMRAGVMERLQLSELVERLGVLEKLAQEFVQCIQKHPRIARRFGFEIVGNKLYRRNQNITPTLGKID